MFFRPRPATLAANQGLETPQGQGFRGVTTGLPHNRDMNLAQRQEAIATILDAAGYRCGPARAGTAARVARLAAMPNLHRMVLLLDCAHEGYGQEIADELTDDLARVSCAMQPPGATRSSLRVVR